MSSLNLPVIYVFVTVSVTLTIFPAKASSRRLFLTFLAVVKVVPFSNSNEIDCCSIGCGVVVALTDVGGAAVVTVGRDVMVLGASSGKVVTVGGM